MKKPIFFFIWLMILAVGLMCVITVTQVITNKSQLALEEGNRQAANTFTLNNRLEDLVNLSFSVENRMIGIVKKGNSTQINKEGLKDTLTQLGYNINVLQLMPIDTANYEGLKKVNYFINKQIDFCFKIIDPQTGVKPEAQKIYADSLLNMHIGDSIYFNAIAFQKKLEKSLNSNLEQNTKESNRLGALNFLLAIISLLAILLLVTIIIRRQKKQLLLIKDLKEARLLALRSGEIKDRFMANMSHEIRTPLNALQGFSRLLSQTALGKEQQRYSNIIYTASENLLTIVNDILDFSKIESDAFTIRKDFFNVKRTLKELEVMFETMAAEKGLQLKMHTDKKIKTLLNGDVDRVKQVLVNLLGNAIKFTKEGSVTLTTTLLEEGDTTLKVKFSVKDTGIGIPLENRTAIFERFEQIDNSFTRNQGGTGLGLAIAKKLAGLMGGTIEVNSVISEGSEFNLILPFEKPSEKNINTKTVDTIYNNPILFKGKTILIAEDNKMNQLLIESIMEKFGAIPIIVQNGYEVLEYMANKKPDLILMDVQMPGMDGITATTLLREKFGVEIPIVAMTAHVLEQEKQKCLHAGMNKYLTKPINENELAATINELIGSDQNETAIHINNSFINEDNNYEKIEYLKSICNNDEIKIREVLQQLSIQLPEEIELYTQLVEEKNIEKLKKLLHNFKSTFSALDDDAIVKITLEDYCNKVDHKNENAFDISEVALMQQALKKCVQNINYMLLKK